MDFDIAIPEGQYIDPEDLLDQDIPANAAYMHKIGHIQRQIVSHSLTLTPKNIKLVKARHRGASVTEAGEEAGYASAASASQTLNRPGPQKLLALLRLYASLIDGPTTAHRKQILFRIARDNEQTEPRITIQAIETLNKMEGTYQDTGISGGINITINQQNLPRTALDG